MERPLTAHHQSTLPEFLSGGGEMGQLIRTYQWSDTPLGEVQQWQQSLRSAISICLNSNFPIAIYWGKDLTLLYNDAWSPIPGSKHPWALGKPAIEVWPEIWEAIEPQFRKAFTGEPGGSKDALLPMHRHGYTEECYFDFTFTPIYGEGGKVEGVFNAVIETTKTILNERQLQTLRDLGNLDRTEKNVDEIFKAAAEELGKNNKDLPFGIIYKIGEENKKATPVSYIGTNKDQTFFPTEIDLTKPEEETANFLKAYATNQIVISENNQRRNNVPKGGWDIEATHFIHLPILNQSRKAPIAILSAALNPYRRFDGLYQQFAQLVADQIATEANNVMAYEEEKKRAEALAEIDKAKTAFFTNISHEFRTPLTLMLGTLEEVLNEPGGDQKNAERLSVTHRNAVRLLKLVNTLLDFSRLEAGRAKADFQLIDVASFTSNVAANFRSAIEHAGLQFHVQCDAAVQAVYIDQEMWEKIVLNLLSNAFKYTLEGSITLSLTTKNNEIILSVKDTGEGIAADELPKIFQRFHRVQNASARTYEGTGIGLSLVNELVHLLGGNITVTSIVGKGSEFVVALPAGQQPLYAGKPAAKTIDHNKALAAAFLDEATSMPDASYPQNGDALPVDANTVLVVDDNADMRGYIQGLLQKQFRVLTASNGMDALQKIAANPVDVVVSDIMMPVMDGIQLLKAVKENKQTANLPVILLSARAGEEAKVEGFDIGADDYLVKPFSSKELVARVQSQINITKKRNKALQDVYHLFDEVPFAVAVLKGEDLVIEYINQYNLNIWQQQKGEVLGKPLFKARPDVRADAAPIHEEVYRTGKRFEAKEIPIELVNNHKKETRYFDVIVDPMRDGEGRVIGQLATSMDVTEQMMAKNQVEENANKLQRLFHQAPAAIAVLHGAEQVFTVANTLYQKLSGRKAEQLIGHSFRQAFPEIEGQGLFELINQVFTTGEPYIAHEFPASFIENEKTKAGYYDFSVQPIKNAEGRVTDIMIHAIEVTEQITARKKIEESEASLNALANAMPQLVWIADTNGEVKYYNDRVYEFSGATKTAEGKWLWDGLVHPDDLQATHASWTKAVSECSVYEIEHRIQMKDGSFRWFLSRGFPQKEIDGNRITWYGTATDIDEVKRAGEKLRFSETILQSLSDAVIAADNNYHVTGWNKAAEEMYGWTAEEMIGTSLSEKAKSRIPDQRLADYKQILAEKGIWKGEVIHTNKFGKELVIYAAAAHLKNEKGEVVGVASVNRDITESKKIEEALKSAKVQLELTFQNVPSAIYHFDKQGNILYLNEKGATQMGYASVEEVLAEKDVFRLRKKLDETFIVLDERGRPLPAERSSAALTFSTGKPSEVVSQFVNRKTGVAFWLLSKSSPLFDEKGELSIVLTTSTDITLQKTSEQVVRQSEEHFRTLAEALPQLVWMTDEKGTYEYTSPQWIEYSGLDPHKETTWSEMVHPDDLRPMMEAWFKSLADGETYHAEARFKNREGSYRWHVAQGEPVKNEAGKIIKWIGAFTDIHDQKTLSEKLEKVVAERTRELQRSNEDLQQFAHVASHDLKEPVRKVRAFSSRLKEELGKDISEKEKIYLQKIENASERMYSMIDGVLMYSSLNAMQQPSELIDLNDLLHTIENDLELSIAQKEAVIHYKNLPVIEGSSILIYQLFYNLINNSLKFSKAHVPPVVKVSAARVAGAAVPGGMDQNQLWDKIVLSDNGIGFSPEYAEVIFQTFARLNPKDKYEGTGLGLALCKKIMERHGGTITANGTMGEGAVFTLLFPAR